MPLSYGPEATRKPRSRPGIAGLALLLPTLLALPLGGCDAIYDDTKGWATRLEASILETAHEMAEPAPEEDPVAEPETASTKTVPQEMAPPPAVPVEPVDSVVLDAPEMQPSLTPPPAPAQVTPIAAADAPEGAMAAASDALLTGQTEAAPEAASASKPGEDPAAAQQAAVPPLPEAKPAMVPAAATAKAEPPAASEPDAAHAMVLHLSSLRSEEAAKREWSELQHSFPEPLGQMQAEFRRTDLGDKGTFYRVLAGPLPSREEAKQVCAALKAKDAKQYCRIMPLKPKA